MFDLFCWLLKEDILQRLRKVSFYCSGEVVIVMVIEMEYKEKEIWKALLYISILSVCILLESIVT